MTGDERVKSTMLVHRYGVDDGSALPDEIDFFDLICILIRVFGQQLLAGGMIDYECVPSIALGCEGTETRSDLNDARSSLKTAEGVAFGPCTSTPG